MIKFQQTANKKKKGEVNLTPMIDIIFNLLIFFLITAVISQKGLNIKLPSADSAEKRPPKSLEISITADKKIIFDGKEISEKQIFEKLKQEKNRPEEEKFDIVTLKSDENAPFGLFVTVMDSARKLGFDNLVIAAERKIEEMADE
jgi:biopolymer transport protein ExbD